jgi:hypothetical protein
MSATTTPISTSPPQSTAPIRSNPRPATLPDRRELVVAAYNASPTPRRVNLAVTAPKGCTLGTPIARILKATDGKPVVVESTASGLMLGPSELLVVTHPLEGTPSEQPPVRRQQFFSDAILREVTPAKPVATTIAAKPGPTRAWIQFVAERLGEGEAVLTLNGTPVPLPACVTPVNSPWIRRVPVDPALVRDTNALRVEVPDKAKAGFLLGALSIVTERE